MVNQWQDSIRETLIKDRRQRGARFAFILAGEHCAILPGYTIKIKEFQKTPTSDFESRLVQQIWIPFSLNFVETFFVYYRTPVQIFERFGSELRLEQWVVGEIQNKITPSHGTSQRAESGEILRNVTISSRSWTFPSLSHARSIHTS